MRGLFLRAVAFVAAVALVFAGIIGYYALMMPAYNPEIGSDTQENKIKGLYLLGKSAAKEDELIVYGSSELRTFEIPQNPANFFAFGRAGFQVNLMGRGSCQSIIHALSIAASGDLLTGKKIVLITSPQSYVKGGIAPDLFFANFSELHYLEIMLDSSIADSVKLRFSERLLDLMAQYERKYGALTGVDASRIMAETFVEGGAWSDIKAVLLRPYFMTCLNLAHLTDLHKSKALLEENPQVTYDMQAPPPIGDWAQERARAENEARGASDNNDFGILNGYYTTYIGSKLSRQKDKDRDLSYSDSVEYDDLRLLMDVCAAKGAEVLFIHVPLHGPWSDYTGFSADRREDYYQKVRDVVSDYDVKLLDLTKNEYETYYLCDVMHLGWKGWLDADEAIVAFYNEK